MIPALKFRPFGRLCVVRVEEPLASLIARPALDLDAQKRGVVNGRDLVSIAVGVVERVGPDVVGLAVGERVVWERRNGEQDIVDGCDLVNVDAILLSTDGRVDPWGMLSGPKDGLDYDAPKRGRAA